jgi:hypothetical protein
MIFGEFPNFCSGGLSLEPMYKNEEMIVAMIVLSRMPKCGSAATVG